MLFLSLRVAHSTARTYNRVCMGWHCIDIYSPQWLDQVKKRSRAVVKLCNKVGLSSGEVDDAELCLPNDNKKTMIAKGLYLLDVMTEILSTDTLPAIIAPTASCTLLMLSDQMCEWNIVSTMTHAPLNPASEWRGSQGDMLVSVCAGEWLSDPGMSHMIWSWGRKRASPLFNGCLSHSLARATPRSCGPSPVCQSKVDKRAHSWCLVNAMMSAPHKATWNPPYYRCSSLNPSLSLSPNINIPCKYTYATRDTLLAMLELQDKSLAHSQ